MSPLAAVFIAMTAFVLVAAALRAGFGFTWPVSIVFTVVLAIVALIVVTILALRDLAVA